MREIETNDRPVAAPMSEAMIAALDAASRRWDRTVCSNRGTTWALFRRGFVEIHRGRGTDRHGRTTYGVIVDVKITDAGRVAVRAAMAAK